MKKYKVDITETEIYHVDVEAKSEEEAERKALDLLESEGGKFTYHNDSDGNIEIHEANE